MDSLSDVYKTGALLNAKRNSSTVKLVQEERKKQIEKQIRAMYKGSEQDEEILEQLINGETIKVEIEEPVINVSDTSKVKTLDEFINESIQKDRETVIEIGESLRDLIENAPEEDVKTFEKAETIEEFANNSINVENENNSEIDEKEKVVDEKNSDDKDLIKPKYFVIEIGDEEKPKQIVVDIEGKDVGEIVDGKFEINEDYFNSKLEKFNIDGYISSKVVDFQEQQKVRQELKPKSLEQLAEMDLDSGKDIVDKTEKVIEGHETEIPPKEEEKGIKDKIDNKELLEDEEDGRKETFEELDEISKEKDGGKKMEDFLEQNSSKKLTILIPYTLTDQLQNHQLKEKGEPITVYQLKGSIKPVFVLQQGDRVLYGDRYNDQIQKNMSKVPYTSGVVREVSDEETTAKVTLADGTTKEFLAKGEPNDINQTQKEEVIARLKELSAELKRIMEITPDDMVDFKIEFPGGIEQKCQIVDSIEMEMYKTCAQYGIVPPMEVKEKAMDQTEKEDIEPETSENGDDDELVRGPNNGGYPGSFGRPH
ncbi:MAG: hypothetical protein ACI4UE_01595 [Candidatus Scatovivens sp.]